MYNNFISEQRKDIGRRIEEKSQKEMKWKRKYQLKILPTLIDQYEKRVISFIAQAAVEDGKEEIELSPSKEHIKRFVFKENEDWRSLRSPRERIELAQHREFQSKKQKCKTLIQQTFTPRSTKQQFRPRTRDKEIHRPMIFSVRPQSSEYLRKDEQQTNHTKKSEKKLNTISHQQKISTSFRRNPSRGTLNSTHRTPHSSKEQHLDDFSILREGKEDNIQIEAQQYEKDQEIVQKKKHFKRLMEMSLKSNNQEYRKEYRKILEKHGKSRPNLFYKEASQLDRFYEIVENPGKVQER